MRTSRTDRQRNVPPSAGGTQADAPRFAQVPWQLQDEPGIDAATIAVFAALQRFCDFGRTTGARVSDAVAAVKAGLSRRAFVTHRETLRRLGWITWKSGKAKGGVNVYVVRQSRGEGVQQMQTPCAGNAEGCAPRAEGGVQQVHTTESHTPRANNRENYSGEFETAWARYPKRVGGNSKSDAYRAWNARLREGITVAVLTTGTERYAAFCRATGKEGSQFVKQARTFFGPGQHFIEPWTLPANGKRAPQTYDYTPDVTGPPI